MLLRNGRRKLAFNEVIIYPASFKKNISNVNENINLSTKYQS